MNKKEAAKILAYIGLNYPDTDKSKTDIEIEAKAAQWARHFSEVNADDVLAAVDAFISTSTDRFAPNIGQIKEELRKLGAGCSPVTGDDAWAHVFKAITNSSYNAEDEFSKLPQEIQKCVGSPNQLREWAQMESGIVNSVIASNFKKDFKARQESSAVAAKLPDCVAKRVHAAAERMKLED